MKRLAWVLATSVLCGLLVGCGGDSRAELVTDTIQVMKDAASQMGTITRSVNAAVDKAKKDGAKQLDLSKALEPTERLRLDVGKKAQQVKARLESQREGVTEEQRKALREDKKLVDSVNDAYGQLVKEKRDLEKALDDAAAYDRRSTDKLRAKIREAVGPFESLARQQ